MSDKVKESDLIRLGLSKRGKRSRPLTQGEARPSIGWAGGPDTPTW
jgi:hypothetical protein